MPPVSNTLPLPNVPIIHRPGEVSGAALLRAPLDVRKRLMVVDDEVPILKLVTRILATDNYDIVSANSGEEAAQLVSSPDFPDVDLLVTDLLMTGMNGRELAAIVRGRYPKARVLYVTGFADTLFKDLSELGEGESFIESLAARHAVEVRRDRRPGRHAVDSNFEAEKSIHDVSPRARVPMDQRQRGLALLQVALQRQEILTPIDTRQRAA